ATPDNTHDKICDSALNQPFLDSNRQCSLLDCGRGVITCQLWYALLLCSSREFLHLGSGLDFILDECDFVDPLNTCATVPPRDDQPNRSAVVFRQRPTVHCGG